MLFLFKLLSMKLTKTIKSQTLVPEKINTNKVVV